MINKQVTYQNQIATLFLVSTPIGSLKNITFDAIKKLKEVTVIFCEDTRITKKLLNHYQIKTKTNILHKYNEKKKINQVLKYLKNGDDVALVSCAGVPLIADPGSWLVKEVLKQDFNVTSVGINNALLASLISSGFDCQSFLFINFLPAKKNQKQKLLEQIIDQKQTIICYESVHKLKTTLKILQEIAPEKNFCLAREMTKLYETFYRGKFKDIDEKEIIFRGEFTLILEGKQKIK